MKILSTVLTIVFISLFPEFVFASTDGTRPDLASHTVGYAAIAIFVLAYAIVMADIRSSVDSAVLETAEATCQERMRGKAFLMPQKHRQLYLHQKRLMNKTKK